MATFNDRLEEAVIRSSILTSGLMTFRKRLHRMVELSE
jgi:hypothetical protein